MGKARIDKMSFRIERGQIIPSHSEQINRSKSRTNTDFHRILEESISRNEKVKISAHAQQRMIERDINLEEGDMNLIKKAMNNLEKKGARESLMLYKDMAFIASVNNRTIITALEYEDIDVVTNIDSAIVVK